MVNFPNLLITFALWSSLNFIAIVMPEESPGCALTLITLVGDATEIADERWFKVLAVS